MIPLSCMPMSRKLGLVDLQRLLFFVFCVYQCERACSAYLVNQHPLVPIRIPDAQIYMQAQFYCIGRQNQAPGDLTPTLRLVLPLSQRNDID